MKFLKILGGIVVAIIVVVLIMIVVLPSTTHIERTTIIAAPPEVVYPEMASLKAFNQWSPWAKMDTAAINEFTGPAFGVGAKMTWKSEVTGNGSMEITRAVENAEVTALMQFDGMSGAPTATWLLEAVPEGTRVTWTYDESDVSGLGKLFGLLLESFLGPDYEQGLADLKARVESAPKLAFNPTLASVPATAYLGISDSSVNDPVMISTKMAQAFGSLMAAVQQNGIEPTGVPFAIYTSYSDTDLSFICALPVADNVTLEDPVITKGQLDNGTAVKVVYTGDYSAMEQAYADIDAFIAYYQYQISGNPWEVYITDPELETDTSKWVTHIFYPVQ